MKQGASPSQIRQRRHRTRERPKMQRIRPWRRVSQSTNQRELQTCANTCWELERSAVRGDKEEARRETDLQSCWSATGKHYNKETVASNFTQVALFRDWWKRRPKARAAEPAKWNNGVQAHDGREKVRPHHTHSSSSSGNLANERDQSQAPNRETHLKENRHVAAHVVLLTKEELKSKTDRDTP